MKTNEKTQVIFRKWANGDIIALFPRIPANGFPWEMLSYEHVGQHGGASMGIIDKTRPAKPDEYATLKAELEGRGYVLDIRQRMSHADAMARHEATRAPK